MALAVPRYNIRDLESFPDDGNRYELLDGLLLVTPAPAPGHQAVVARLVMALGEYLESSGAQVYSPGAVEIEPDMHLEPDILVVPASEPIAERWSDIRSWWLAVEVSGRGSLVYDRDFKFGAYAALGVRHVWLVDIHQRCLVERQGGGVPRSHRRQFNWRPEGLDAPLAVDIPALFHRVQSDG